MEELIYQVTTKEPQYDVEEEIEKLLDNLGKELPDIHNAFLCRDGDFYADPDVPHHDDEVREIGYLAGLKFGENEDVTADDIHEFMYRTGIIRGHRFENIPQYDFDVVFPPTNEQIKTMWNVAVHNPNVDIGWAVGFTLAERIYGRGIKELIQAIAKVFMPDGTELSKHDIHENASLQASMTIQDYRPGEGLFIRSFFADNAFNANKWGVTQEALNRDIATGVEKDYFDNTAPIIDTPEDGHPPDDVPDMIIAQEPFRKGDFLRTGIDPFSKRAYVDAIIKDPKTIERIQNGELNYVSPSIRAIDETHTSDGKIRVTRFKINHLALVKRPAYGEMKAQIKGRCSGTAEQCLPILANVQASTNIGIKPCGGIMINISAESVPDMIKQKIKSGSPLSVVDVTSMLNSHNDHVYEKFEGSDQMETPAHCRVCGQPLFNHDAKTGHTYIAEDSSEQINQQQDMFKRNDIAEDHKACPMCTGGEDTSSCSTCGGHGKISITKRDYLIATIKQADDCVSEWIPELKSAHPEMKQDQIVAIAYEKCRKGEHKGSYHLKIAESAEIKALKGNNDKNNSMSTSQDNKISPEEQRRKDLENQAALKADSDEKMKKLEDENKDMKAEIASFKATLDAEVKTPIVNQIVQARVKAGTLKEAERQAVTESLMKHDIQYLKSMQADYSAMIKVAETISKTNSTPQTPRFTYSASDNSKTEADKVLNHIRSRMR